MGENNAQVCFHLPPRVAQASRLDQKNVKIVDLHSRDRVGPQLPVILHWNIPSLLKLKAGVHSQLFASRFTEGFGPLGLAWVLLLLEVFVAF